MIAPCSGTHPLTCTMIAPCSGGLATALLLVPAVRANLLAYTGSNGFQLALQSLAKAILKRPSGLSLDEEVEAAHVHELFLEYKKLRDPIRTSLDEGPLTVDDDEDPSEVVLLAEVLSLQATAGLQVHSLSSPRLALWQQLKEWLVVLLRGDGCAVASAEIP